MWLFDSRGFVSVVAYDPSKDRNKNSKFSSIAKQAGTHVLIRARIKEDLNMLKSVVPNLHIETDKSADYSFRCVMTRKHYKKFLAQSVDQIDYDSHFKEAARDKSPQATGRYSAMMSVWSEMARLQPYTPYGGGYTSPYGSSYAGTVVGGKSTPTSTTKVEFSGTAGSKKSAVKPGVADMDAYIASLPQDKPAHFTGAGPRVGLKNGDLVEGHFGVGTVTKIQPRTSTLNGAELVCVEFVRNGKETSSTFVSNYLTPLLDIEPLGDTTLEDVYETYLKAQTHLWPVDQMSDLSVEGLELTIRVGEAVDSGEEFNPTLVRKHYEDLVWEYASDEEKVALALDGAVPERHVHEVTALLNKQA